MLFVFCVVRNDKIKKQLLNLMCVKLVINSHLLKQSGKQMKKSQRGLIAIYVPNN